MTFSITSGGIAAILAVASLAVAPASAQDVNIGSPAPALSVEEWLKGDAVAGFKPGQVYVVEFWATWCPPCIVSIPHLTQVQKQYRDAKLTVIGVAASERGKPGSDLRSPLVKFVADKGDAMGYTVGYDSDHSMSKSWMDAAHQSGIPTAFVVDAAGLIAWIGHPMEMDEPLAKIMAGTWDTKAEAEKARIAAELDAKLQPILRRASEAAEKADWDAALAALDEGIALGDDALKELAWFKYNVLIEKKDFEAAFGFIAQGLKGPLKDDADLLNAVAWAMVDEEQESRFEKKDYELAILCSQRACELAKGKPNEAPGLSTLAAVHFAKGDAAKALEIQTRAVELMKDKPELERFKEKLEIYKQAVSKG